MTKNTTEVMHEILDKLMNDVLQNEYCSKWDCDECPCYIKESGKDPWDVPYKCGWLLLKSATSKIGRR